MKKLYSALSMAVLLAAAAPNPAGAYTITYGGVNDASGGLTTAVSGAYVETFDPIGTFWNWGPADQYKVQNGDVYYDAWYMLAAAPVNAGVDDTTNYMAVPKNGNPYNSTNNGEVTATATGPLTGLEFDYFGLWWGSVDDYNSITFVNNGVDVLTITGTQAINPSEANGNQYAPSTNLYVNFFGLPTFDSFKLSSTQFAFESDNIAVRTPVPEPSTLLLLGCGLLGLVGLNRRRRS